MFDILFKNIDIITMEDACPAVRRGFLGVSGGKIAYLDGKAPENTGAKRVIEGKDRLIMPGLINTHAHTPMCVMRGYADDYALQEWLFEKIFPAEGRLTPKAVRLGSELAFAELLRNGVTSVTDMYFFIQQTAEAALNAGIKLNISNALLCLDPDNFDLNSSRTMQESMEVLKNYHGADDGRIKLDAAIHAAYTCPPHLMESMRDLALEHSLNMHLHLSETKREHEEIIEKYGKTATALFYEHGVFDVPTTAAHCVWVSGEDMDMMAEKGVTCAHNPVSNLKLGSGVAPVALMAAKGINVSLGTDGCASNNTLDMFEEIKFSALLQKGANLDPALITACQALKFATANGAAAQGRLSECGTLAIGKDADIIMLNMDTPSLAPIYDLFSTVVYAAKGSDVCLTMVKGRILYENGEFLTIDFNKVKSEVEDICMPLVRG